MHINPAASAADFQPEPIVVLADATEFEKFFHAEQEATIYFSLYNQRGGTSRLTVEVRAGGDHGTLKAVFTIEPGAYVNNYVTRGDHVRIQGEVGQTIRYTHGVAFEFSNITDAVARRVEATGRNVLQVQIYNQNANSTQTVQIDATRNDGTVLPTVTFEPKMQGSYRENADRAAVAAVAAPSSYNCSITFYNN